MRGATPYGVNLPSPDALMRFLPERGISILRQILATRNGYETLGNFRFVRVAKEVPGEKDVAALEIIPGFYFPPTLLMPLLRRYVLEEGKDYRESMAASPVIKVDDDLLPPESLDEHVVIYTQSFQRRFAHHDGPIDLLGHSYGYQVLRHCLITLQHDPRIRRVDIVAPYLGRPEHIRVPDEMLAAGRAGHRQELFRALTYGRLEEFVLDVFGFSIYERNGHRYEEAFKACLKEMLTIEKGADDLPPISEVPVSVYVPEKDFLRFAPPDEGHIREVFTHPESKVVKVSGGHNKLVLRIAEGMRDLKGPEAPAVASDAPPKVVIDLRKNVQILEGYLQEYLLAA